MKYIEIKSEGYTFRHDFAPVPSSAETFNPHFIVPTENRSSASESLDICLDLLSFIFGKENVRKVVIFRQVPECNVLQLKTLAT